MKAETHAWATRTLQRAWPRVHGAREFPLGTLQSIRGIGGHEGAYGLAGKPAGWAETKNWAAAQRVGAPHPLDRRFPDTHADGSGYTAWFKGYETHEDAAEDLIRLVTVRRPWVWAVLDSGDYGEIARQMHTPGPDGHGGTLGAYFEDKPEHYAKAIEASAREAAAALGEHFITPDAPAPIDLSGLVPYPGHLPAAVISKARELLTTIPLGATVRDVDPAGRFRFIVYKKEPHDAGKVGITVYAPRAGVEVVDDGPGFVTVALLAGLGIATAWKVYERTEEASELAHFALQ